MLGTLTDTQMDDVLKNQAIGLLGGKTFFDTSWLSLAHSPLNGPDSIKLQNAFYCICLITFILFRKTTDHKRQACRILISQIFKFF
jgi:hypothetical protein